MNNFIFFGAKHLGDHSLNYFLNKKVYPKYVITMSGGISDKTKIRLEKERIDYIKLDSFKDNIKKIISIIEATNCKIIISSAFPFILTPEILIKVEYALNVHTAALPKYKGIHPISSALLNDDRVQGTTVHLMREEVDSGEIILQDYIEIHNEDTIITIRDRLIRLSSKLLLIAYNQICSKTYCTRKQVGESSWAPKRKPQDSRIEFDNTSRYLSNFIRALESPYPNAFGYIKSDGKKIQLSKVLLSNEYGKVLDKTITGKYVISSNDGVIVVECDQDLKIGDIIT